MCTQQEFGEVDETGLLAGVLVEPVQVDQLPPVLVTAVVDVIGSPALILLLIDEILDLARHPRGLIEFEVAAHPPDQPLLVLGVYDLKCLLQARLAPVPAQHPVREAVERADPEVVDRHAE